MHNNLNFSCECYAKYSKISNTIVGYKNNETNRADPDQTASEEAHGSSEAV